MRLGQPRPPAPPPALSHMICKLPTVFDLCSLRRGDFCLRDPSSPTPDAPPTRRLTPSTPPTPDVTRYWERGCTGRAPSADAHGTPRGTLAQFPVLNERTPSTCAPPNPHINKSQCHPSAHAYYDNESERTERRNIDTRHQVRQVLGAAAFEQKRLQGERDSVSVGGCEDAEPKALVPRRVGGTLVSTDTLTSDTRLFPGC